MKKIYSEFFAICKRTSLIALTILFCLCVKQSANGQAATSTWTLTASNTPVVTGNVTAAVPTFGTAVTAQGSLDATFGFHGTGWPIANALAMPLSTNNNYIQFSVAPTAGNSLTI